MRCRARGVESGSRKSDLPEWLYGERLWLCGFRGGSGRVAPGRVAVGISRE